MSFDSARWPDAVTISWLIAERMGMGVHCQKCAHHAVLDPASPPFAPETPVPALAGRFKCTRCGSGKTEARPEWPSWRVYIAGR
jgi:hypothetical protein